MKYHYFSLVTVASIGLLILTSRSVPCMASEVNNKTVKSSTDFDLATLSGSPMRRAVLDALRQKMKRLSGLNMVFVVKYLKVKKGWAWVHTLPQSSDGKNHYEDVSALLHLKNDTWEIAELACTEEKNPKCLSNPNYFLELKKRFPKVPDEILPEN